MHSRLLPLFRLAREFSSIDDRSVTHSLSLSRSLSQTISRRRVPYTLPQTYVQFRQHAFQREQRGDTRLCMHHTDLPPSPPLFLSTYLPFPFFPLANYGAISRVCDGDVTLLSHDCYDMQAVPQASMGDAHERQATPNRSSLILSTKE